jgi:hypothetical protein
MSISFIGSATNSTSAGPDLDVSGTGRASGDLILIVEQAYNSDTTIPAGVTPSGFTQIGSSATGLQGNIGARVNAFYKVSTGSEANVTAMAPNLEHDLMALVFRTTNSWAATPASGYQVSLVLAGSAGPLTISNPGGVCAFVGHDGSSSSVQLWSSTPAEDAQIYNSTGTSQTAAYKIYNSSPANVTINTTADCNSMAGFFIAESGAVAGLPCGQGVL